jgi:hypothetical protein
LASCDVAFSVFTRRAVGSVSHAQLQFDAAGASHQRCTTPPRLGTWGCLVDVLGKAIADVKDRKSSCRFSSTARFVNSSKTPPRIRGDTQHLVVNKCYIFCS